MRAVIVGAGPTGLYTAIALARRGHQVTVIDRDPGPDGGQWWDRKGVMQFHHPHHFRQQVADALLAEMPEVWHGLLAAGAEPATLPGQPGVPAGSWPASRGAPGSRRPPRQRAPADRRGRAGFPAPCPGDVLGRRAGVVGATA